MISPIPPEASYLLHGDLLTLHALGVTQVPIHSAFPPAKPDPREHLPPAPYFALLRAICLSLHPLRAAHFQSFLPPVLYDFLTKNQITPSHSDHVPSLHIAATHWIFTAWPNHFFTYLDTLEQWSWQVKKPHAFSSFPQRFLLGSKAQEAYTVLSHASRAYQTGSRASGTPQLLVTGEF
jgi:hypothetical protein